MASEHVRVVERVCAHWSRGAQAMDLDAIDAPYREGLLSADCAHTPVQDIPDASGRTFVGADGQREFILAWISDWVDWRIELLRAVDVGERHVAAELRQTAVGRGSGTPVDLRYGTVATFRDGQVVEHRDYADFASALAAARAAAGSPGYA